MISTPSTIKSDCIDFDVFLCLLIILYMSTSSSEDAFMIVLYSLILCMACSLRWELHSLRLVSLHFAFKITFSASVLAFFSSQNAALFSFTHLEIFGDQILCLCLFCLIRFEGTLTSAAFLIAFVTCINRLSILLVVFGGRPWISLSSTWRHLLYLARSILSQS